MTGTDVLGHVFYACLFLGQFLLTRKSTWGWACRFVGDLGWAVLGFTLGLTCIWSWGILFLLNDIKGYLTWTHEKKKAQELSQDAA